MHTHAHIPICTTPGHCPCLVRISPALCKSRAVTNAAVLYAALLSVGRLIKLSAEQFKNSSAVRSPLAHHKRSKLNSVRPLALKSDGKMTFADCIFGHRWRFVSLDIKPRSPHTEHVLCVCVCVPLLSQLTPETASTTASTGGRTSVT